MAAKDIIPFQFKPGKSGNPKGRPKGLMAKVNKQLVKAGHLPATKSDIRAASMILVNLPFDVIKQIAEGTGDEYPFFYRLVAKELLGKRRIEMLDRLLDRGIDKATQPIDHTTGGQPLSLNISVDTKSHLDKINKLE